MYATANAVYAAERAISKMYKVEMAVKYSPQIQGSSLQS